MTTIAMAAGMFPSALGLGDGGGFRSPMAIAVIGGLIMSTMLSLVFVPAVFTVLDDLGSLYLAPRQPFHRRSRTNPRRKTRQAPALFRALAAPQDQVATFLRSFRRGGVEPTTQPCSGV